MPGAERASDAALERRRLLASPDATVIRDGMVRRLEAALIVSGDVVVLAEGDIVAADGIVTIHESGCRVNRSRSKVLALTTCDPVSHRARPRDGTRAAESLV